MTHCKTEFVAWKSRAMAGKAVLTTAPSKKIMNVESDITASTRFFLTFLPDSLVFGVSNVVVAISSSQFANPVNAEFLTGITGD